MKEVEGKQKEQTRHMTEERDFLPEKKRTAEMTWLSIHRVEQFLRSWITHSEIRMGWWDEFKEFIPWDFDDSLFRKKECKNIPIIKANV